MFPKRQPTFPEQQSIFPEQKPTFPECRQRPEHRTPSEIDILVEFLRTHAPRPLLNKLDHHSLREMAQIMNCKYLSVEEVLMEQVIYTGFKKN
jgi:hypothetical protein